MLQKHLLFIFTIAAIVLFVAGTIFYQERIHQQGDVVILETTPIDPRDLFRGEYVILRYVIETDEFVRSVIEENEDAPYLYVQLDRDDRGVGSVVAVQTNPPDWSTGLWLVGEVQGDRVRFPMLEQYYVPEGAGLPIERLGTDVHVAVSLYDGQARILEILDNDLVPIDPTTYLAP